MEKTILLVGQTGHGKSSFVNCIAGLSSSLMQLAKESDNYESCTNDINMFKMSSSLIGPIHIIDTQGLNDTGKNLSDNEILFKILSHFYKNDISFDIDAILYLSDSEIGRFYYEKNMELFSRIFDDNLDSISKSVVFLFTKYEDLINRKKQKLDDFIKEISLKYSRPVIRWDSKYPLQNDDYDQFYELNHAIESCKKYSFNLGYFNNEITKIATDLREKEKEIVDPFERKTCVQQGKEFFTHIERISQAGVVVGFSFGITLLFNDLVDNQRFFLHPPYPENSENRRIENIRYEVTRRDQVKHFNFRYELSDSKDYANVYSEIRFNVCVFGQASIEYSVTYDYSYDIVVPNQNPSYRYKPLESYMKKAKEMFFSKKMECLRNVNCG